MLALRRSRSARNATNPLHSGKFNGAQMLSELTGDIPAGIEIDLSRDFIIQAVFTDTSKGMFGKVVGFVIAVLIIFIVLGNGLLFGSVGRGLPDFTDSQQAFSPPEPTVFSLGTLHRDRDEDKRRQQLGNQR